MQWGFLVFAPSDAAPATTFIASITPSDGAVDVAPNTAVRVEIVNAATTVQADSIALTLDGADVTALATLTTNQYGAVIEYRPSVLLPGTHTASIRYQDSAHATAQTDWSFTVATVPGPLPAWAAPVGSGANRGFNVRSAQTFDATGLPRTLARAEDQLAVPPQVTVDYTGNDTPTVINYKETANNADNGLFTTASGFPDRVADQSEARLIAYDPANPVQASNDNFAVEVTFFLELVPGYVQTSVFVNDSFQLTAGRGGATSDAFPLVLGEFPGEAEATYPCNFIVSKPGVYAFRLIWAEYAGTSGLELHVKDAQGVTNLVNAAAAPFAAYRSRTQEPPIEAVRLGIIRAADGSVTITWEGRGTLQSAPAVSRSVGTGNRRHQPLPSDAPRRAVLSRRSIRLGNLIPHK